MKAGSPASGHVCRAKPRCCYLDNPQLRSGTFRMVRRAVGLCRAAGETPAGISPGVTIRDSQSAPRWEVDGQFGTWTSNQCSSSSNPEPDSGHFKDEAAHVNCSGLCHSLMPSSMFWSHFPNLPALVTTPLLTNGRGLIRTKRQLDVGQKDARDR